MEFIDWERSLELRRVDEATARSVTTTHGRHFGMIKTDLTPGQIERVRLERQLAQLQLTAPFPTESAIAAHKRQVEDLEEKIAALPALP